jgi:hypothetical protein
MAETPDNWRTNLERKRDEERKTIDSALATNTAFWIIAVIIAGVVGWAIVGTFIH